jgi:hypothetical protein
LKNSVEHSPKETLTEKIWIDILVFIGIILGLASLIPSTEPRKIYYIFYPVATAFFTDLYIRKVYLLLLKYSQYLRNCCLLFILAGIIITMDLFFRWNLITETISSFDVPGKEQLISRIIIFPFFHIIITIIIITLVQVVYNLVKSKAKFAFKEAGITILFYFSLLIIYILVDDILGYNFMVTVSDQTGNIRYLNMSTLLYFIIAIPVIYYLVYSSLIIKDYYA